MNSSEGWGLNHKSPLHMQYSRIQNLFSRSSRIRTIIFSLRQFWFTSGKGNNIIFIFDLKIFELGKNRMNRFGLIFYRNWREKNWNWLKQKRKLIYKLLSKDISVGIQMWKKVKWNFLNRIQNSFMEGVGVKPSHWLLNLQNSKNISHRCSSQ